MTKKRSIFYAGVIALAVTTPPAMAQTPPATSAAELHHLTPRPLSPGHLLMESDNAPRHGKGQHKGMFRDGHGGDSGRVGDRNAVPARGCKVDIVGSRPPD